MAFVLECACGSRSFDLDPQPRGLTVYCCKGCGIAGTVRIDGHAGLVPTAVYTGPARLVPE